MCLLLPLRCGEPQAWTLRAKTGLVGWALECGRKGKEEEEPRGCTEVGGREVAEDKEQVRPGGMVLTDPAKWE